MFTLASGHATKRRQSPSLAQRLCRPEVEVLEGRTLPSTAGSVLTGVLVETIVVAPVVIVRIEVISVPSAAPPAAASDHPSTAVPAETASLRLTTSTQTTASAAANAPDAFNSETSPAASRAPSLAASPTPLFTFTPFFTVGSAPRTGVLKQILPDMVANDYNQYALQMPVAATLPVELRTNAPLPTVVQAIANRMEFLGGSGGVVGDVQELEAPSPAPPPPRPIMELPLQPTTQVPIPAETSAQPPSASLLTVEAPTVPDLVYCGSEDQPIVGQELVMAVAALIVGAGAYPLSSIADNSWRLPKLAAETKKRKSA